MSEDFVRRNAHRGDRPLLQGFCCAPEPVRDPFGRPIHQPCPWEVEVQSWIRAQTPPDGPNESLRLEVGGDTVRAVSAVVVAAQSGPLVVVKIQAIAVSVRWRGGDHSVADAAVTDALEEAERMSLSGGGDRAIVVAWVHPQNAASTRLLSRFGFAYSRPAPEGLEQWESGIILAARGDPSQ